MAFCGALALCFTLAASSQQAVPAPQPAAAGGQTAPDTAQQPAAPSANPEASGGTNQAPAKAPDATQTPAAAPAAAKASGADTPAVPEAPASAAAQSPSAAATPAVAPVAGAKGKTAKESESESQAGGITEEELKQLLVGKPLYLRSGYLENSLNFNEHGGLIGHSPQGSYTLSAIQIEHVRLTKHKVELEGARYGLHFLGALPYEDPTKALDRVRITPKKKVVKISIDRELVVTPKKKKVPPPPKVKKGKGGVAAPTAVAATATPPPGVAVPAGSGTAAAPMATSQAGEAPAAQPAASAEPEEKELTEAEQVKAEVAAAPEAERPVDPGSVTTTTSPAHAAKLLKGALDNIFAEGLDERVMAGMPDFWKLYYQAVAAKSDYRPADPAVLRQNHVDKKARLLSRFEPESNEYAQANAVAGMALYHTVIGADGKPGEIAVARPIGFGLDENAVEAIRKAQFEPAMKDGKPVPVLLDLVVQFRIYSRRTAAVTKPEAGDKAGDKPAEAQLPGPYSVQHQ